MCVVGCEVSPHRTFVTTDPQIVGWSVWAHETPTEAAVPIRDRVATLPYASLVIAAANLYSGSEQLAIHWVGNEQMTGNCIDVRVAHCGMAFATWSGGSRVAP